MGRQLNRDAANTNVVPMRKGFRMPEHNTTLDFSGTDYAGAEIHVRLRVPLIFFFNISEIASTDQRKSFKMFGDQVLISWNLEYGSEAGPDLEGTPMPADGDGMLALPMEFANDIVHQWNRTIQELSSPLGTPSETGTKVETA